MFEIPFAGAILAVIALLVTAADDDGAAATMRLPVTKDASMNADPSERDSADGSSPRLKLKYLEEMGLVAFDTAALEGRRVTRACLYSHSVPETTKAEMARLGIPESLVSPLRYVGVSTVSSRWSEERATFNESVAGEKAWSWRGSRLWDVIFGAGNSVCSSDEIEKLDSYWWRLPVSPEVMNVLVAGGGDGLCVMEESNAPWDLAPDNFVHTRESGEFAPFVEVETVPAEAPPDAPSDLQVQPAPQASTLDHGALELSLTVPDGALCYRILVDAEQLEAWMVARPRHQRRKQTFVITDLPPAREVELSFQVVGAGGLSSPPVTVAAVTSPALRRPVAEVVSFAVPSGAAFPTAEAGPVRVWAYPELVKVDPVSGEFLSGIDPAESKDFNSVYDARSQQVTLVAARGEIAAFQVAVEAVAAPVEEVSLEMEALEGPDGAIPRESISLYREWYVKPAETWQAEYAVPLSGAVAIPDRQNGIQGQTCRSFWADVAIPKETPPGEYRGTLTVAADGERAAELLIRVIVRDAVLPDRMTFYAELNGYSAPGGAGTPYYYQAHRIAHYNRCCINIVPYHQGRQGDAGYRPRTEGSGGSTRVVDWSQFDRIQGPLLDGTAFAGLPRDGVPVRTFYLPFFEYWPAEFLENYAWEGEPSAETINLNYLTAPRIEEAVSEDFKAAWRRVVPEFVRHFNGKGWNHPVFECYFNNKWNNAKTMFWNLDEPAVREDYRAIRFFARLFRDSLGDTGDVKVLFRGDISRPQWQFDDFNGLIDIEYVNASVVDMVRTVRETNRRAGSVFTVYGHANDLSTSNLETVQWCFTSFAAGALGVLPWNSFDPSDAFTTGSRNGLIVDGAPVGHEGPLASIRVFAFRRGVQDVEIVRLLAEKKGWTLDQAAVYVNAFVPLGAHFTQSFTDEAAAPKFEAAGSAGLISLRNAALDALRRT